MVSTDDYNDYFFVLWSPNHINTSSDGRTRRISLDQQSGDREERMYLWFDPTRDFHTYSILWSLYHIVVMVDWVPIRVYRNHEEKGVAYPRWQPMSVKASIWDGGSWATRGGKDKIDWSAAPFVASFGDYSPGPCGESGGGNWWNDTMLTWPQRRLLKWARNYHLVYDYCHDNKRFNFTLPKECSLPMY